MFPVTMTAFTESRHEPCLLEHSLNFPDLLWHEFSSTPVTVNIRMLTVKGNNSLRMLSNSLPMS